VAFAAGCLGTLVGAVLGVLIAFGVPTTETTEPQQVEHVEEKCGEGHVVSVLSDMVGRFVLGAVGGAALGGIGSLILVSLLARLDRRPNERSHGPAGES
jgi:hypothetical protein